MRHLIATLVGCAAFAAAPAIALAAHRVPSRRTAVATVVEQIGTKLANTEMTGDDARGKVRSSKRACRRNRKVILRGPEPRWIGDARFPRAGMVIIGTDRTNRKGGWSLTPHAGSFLRPGFYTVKVKAKRLSDKHGGKICAPVLGAFEN
jgi:hypothetical protein